MSPATALRLWRQNRLDQPYELTAEQIAEGFERWLASHEPRLNFHLALAYYLADGEGANSSWEAADLAQLEGRIYDLTRPAWMAYVMSAP